MVKRVLGIFLLICLAFTFATSVYFFGTGKVFSPRKWLTHLSIFSIGVSTVESDIAEIWDKEFEVTGLAAVDNILGFFRKCALSVKTFFTEGVTVRQFGNLLLPWNSTIDGAYTWGGTAPVCNFVYTYDDGIGSTSEPAVPLPAPDESYYGIYYCEGWRERYEIYTIQYASCYCYEYNTNPANNGNKIFPQGIEMSQYKVDQRQYPFYQYRIFPKLDDFSTGEEGDYLPKPNYSPVDDSGTMSVDYAMRKMLYSLLVVESDGAFNVPSYSGFDTYQSYVLYLDYKVAPRHPIVFTKAMTKFYILCIQYGWEVVTK